MKAIRDQALLLITLTALLSCSNQPTQPTTKLHHFTEAQQKTINDEQLNAEYLSGCVTELLHDAREKLCEQNNTSCEMTSIAGSLLSFEQTMAIYKQCQVKTQAESK